MTTKHVSLLCHIIITKVQPIANDVIFLFCLYMYFLFTPCMCNNYVMNIIKTFINNIHNILYIQGYSNMQL